MGTPSRGGLNTNDVFNGSKRESADGAKHPAQTLTVNAPATQCKDLGKGGYREPPGQ